MHLRDCFYKGLIVAVCSYFYRLYMQIFSFSFWAVVIRHACYTKMKTWVICEKIRYPLLLLCSVSARQDADRP